MLKTAIILAAGRGSRLDPKGAVEDFSKPLLKLDGQSLLERTVTNCRSAGIEKIWVVTGFRAKGVTDEIERINKGDIASIHNDDWQKSNGLSLLVCKDAVRESFALMMCDHVFDPSILKDLIHHPLPEKSVVLATDNKIESIFDMDDATKVDVKDGRIQAISKTLSSFNAIDCGLFACTTAIFDALADAAKATGDCSLSQGMDRVSQAGGFFAFDIGPRWWQDVDTPDMLDEALRQLAKLN